MSVLASLPGARLAARLRRPAGAPVRLVSYFMAGHPARARFASDLLAIAAASDVVEIGLPFSDPVADGPALASAARTALAGGATLNWLCAALEALPARPAAPLVLMSYLNPLLAGGIERALARLANAGIEGLIVPDLPLEELDEVRPAADGAGIALVQLVAPNTPAARMRALAEASRGFVYAVTRTGTTGSATAVAGAHAFLSRVRAASALPVAAGFGLRSREQLRDLGDAVDAAVVGTAVVECLGRDADAGAFLRGLRAEVRP